MKARITFDKAQAEGEIRRFKQTAAQEIQAVMQTVADAALEESVKRAPIDEGFLQHSLTDRVETNGNNISAVVFVPANSPASDYAIPMHEDDYQLGKVSRQKQAKQSVRVGRKYLERAFGEERAKLAKLLIEGLKRLFT